MKPKVHYRVCKSLPLLVLCHISPVQAPLPFLSDPFIIIPHRRPDLSSNLFPSGSPTKLYAFPFSPMRATFSAHLTFLHCVTQIVLAVEYQLGSCALCVFFTVLLVQHSQPVLCPQSVHSAVFSAVQCDGAAPQSDSGCWRR